MAHHTDTPGSQLRAFGEAWQRRPGEPVEAWALHQQLESAAA